MKYSKREALRQSEELMQYYPDMHLCLSTEEEIALEGTILINRTAKGFTLYKTYAVKVVVPLGTEDLPYVIDAGNAIDSQYPHRYRDGKLCLETDASIKVRFVGGMTLRGWMSEFVESYYFSYEFYQRYGEFPFGERSHGLVGIIQTYSDFFHEPDVIKTIRIMASIVSSKYRGHQPCPCGSGKKLRSCHGPFTMNFYMDDRLKDIVREDFFLLREAAQKADEQQHDTRKTER